MDPLQLQPLHINSPQLWPHFSEEDEAEWTYRMRREMQEIVPKLFLGPYSVASKSGLDLLSATGITHIVCVRQQVQATLIKPNFPQHFKYLVLEIEDKETENIMQFFPQVNEFIISSLREGGKVLVHGTNGCSRSATLVQAFLMRHCGLSCATARCYLLTRRYCTNTVLRFGQQLKDYEPMCEAYLQQQLNNDHTLQERISLKRKREEEGDNGGKDGEGESMDISLS